MAEPLGYTVIETDADGRYPTFCVHGPDPLDTDLETAKQHQASLTSRYGQRGERYVVCKVVPLEDRERG